jgi:hypothetical protein
MKTKYQGQLRNMLTNKGSNKKITWNFLKKYNNCTMWIHGVIECAPTVTVSMVYAATDNFYVTVGSALRFTKMKSKSTI